MTDFKKQLLALLEREIPELADKIQAGAVDVRTPAPFAAFSGTEHLKRRAIAALEGAEFDGKRSRFVSSATEYYADYDLHGATMSFRII